MKNMKKFIVKLFTAVALLGVSAGAGASIVAPVEVSAQRLGASSASGSGSGSQSFDNLASYVVDQVGDNIYVSNTGDTYYGRDILDASGNVSDKFDLLTEPQKQQFMTDVQTATDNKRDSDVENGVENNPVTQDTITNYWKVLAQRETVASRQIVLATRDIRPNFDAAARFLAPFTPHFNTFIAIFLILAAFAFFIFLAVDIFYFNAPPFQYFVQNGGENVVSKLAVNMVSERAKASLQESQNGKGNPLLKYIIKSWAHLVAFGLTFLYFTTGSMLALVGPLVNLFAGLFF